jgi:hypothetical protein
MSGISFCASVALTNAQNAARRWLNQSRRYVNLVRSVVHEFDYMVPVSMPELEASKARRALNILHYGAEIIPLDEAHNKIPDVLRNAHYQMHMTHQFKVRVKVWSDGQLEMCASGVTQGV